MLFSLATASCSLHWNLNCFLGKHIKIIFLYLIPIAFEKLKIDKTKWVALYYLWLYHKLDFTAPTICNKICATLQHMLYS